MSKKIFIIVLVVLIALSCAKRGYITGGEKDIYPPKILKTIPENFTTNFKSQEIIIQFDEFVKLKDASKQIIVSPPQKNRLDITPSNVTKQIKIRFRDTLIDNTTYSINFGQSIEDNNEGNKLQGYKYIFSTGNYIDSLSISGYIKDALDKDSENFVSVMLYEINENFNDSIVFKENPRYITNTLDSLTSFSIENIKEGKYLLIALKDKNNNYRFEPKQDKIAYHNEIISIPTEENFKLELFKEETEYKPMNAFESTKSKITFGYEGNAKNTVFELKNGNNNIETITTKVIGKDSLNIWYKPIEADSVILKTKNKNSEKNYTIKLKEKKNDSLNLFSNTSNHLHFRENFSYTSSIPITSIDKSKIKLINKDSLAIDFNTKYDSWNQKIDFIFEKEEKQKYSLTLYPNAVTDFFDNTNDTLISNFSTTNYSDYGNLRVNIKNIKEFPIIVQLTDDKGNVLAEHYSVEESTIDFSLLRPNMYNLRVVYDSNKNEVWDTGSFLQKIQPEKVIYFPSKIDLRANWDVEENFNLVD